MTHRRAVWILLGCTFIWGASFVLNKMALAYTTPLLFMSLRFGCAALLLSGVYRSTTRNDWVVGLSLGSLFAAQLALFYIGLARIDPGRSAFLFGVQTPLVPILVLAAHRRAPTARDIVTVTAAMLGAWWLTRPAGGTAGFGLGDLATLGSGTLAAFYVVLASHVGPRHDPMRLLAVQLVAIAGLAALATVAFEHPRIELNLTTLTLTPFLALASVASFGGQLMGQRLVRATEAALIFALEPVVAAGVSILAFGERFTPEQWLGGAVILAASVAAQAKKR